MSIKTALVIFFAASVCIAQENSTLISPASTSPASLFTFINLTMPTTTIPLELQLNQTESTSASTSLMPPNSTVQQSNSSTCKEFEASCEVTNKTMQSLTHHKAAKSHNNTANRHKLHRIMIKKTGNLTRAHHNRSNVTIIRRITGKSFGNFSAANLVAGNFTVVRRFDGSKNVTIIRRFPQHKRGNFSTGNFSRKANVTFIRRRPFKRPGLQPLTPKILNPAQILHANDSSVDVVSRANNLTSILNQTVVPAAIVVLPNETISSASDVKVQVLAVDNHAALNEHHEEFIEEVIEDPN